MPGSEICRALAAWMLPRLADSRCEPEVIPLPASTQSASPGTACCDAKFGCTLRLIAADVLAFGRDLLNSSDAGHESSIQLFTQLPHYATLAATYGNSDWEEPLRVVRTSAELTD